MTCPVPESLEVVDRGAGRVAAAGALTERSADLLRGVALALQDRGHRRVVLDLEGVRTADAAGLRVLRATQRAMTADLVVLHPATLAEGEPVAPGPRRGRRSRPAPTPDGLDPVTGS